MITFSMKDKTDGDGLEAVGNGLITRAPRTAGK